MQDGEFKTCPYCKEQIRATAIKCRFCGEWLESVTQPGEEQRKTRGVALEPPLVASPPLPIAVAIEPPAIAADSTLLPAVDRAQPETSVAARLSIPKKANYFVRHWRGELSLGVAYWVNNIFAYALVAAAGGFISTLNKTVSLKATAAAHILLYILSLTVSVWQIVGILRSSSKHVERGGRPAWATLARLGVVLIILSVARLTTQTIVPQTVEYWNILAGDNRFPAYEIRVLPGGTEVEFRGGLRAGSARELQRILDAAPQAKVLHLNSGGGRILEAERMARLVREHGLVTYTSDECLSAATLVFISGKERVVSSRAKVGFHRSSFPGMTDQQRLASDESNREIMRSAGVSEEFIHRVLATPEEEMWYPSFEEMRLAGVVTSQSFGERFAASGSLLRYSSSGDIGKIFGAIPVFRVLKKLEPSAYEKMITEYSAAIQAGKSEGEAINRARGQMEPLVMKYLPAASDEALRTMRNVWVNVLDHFKDKDSRMCIAWFSPKSAGTNYNYNFASLLPGWLATNGIVAVEKVFLSASERSAPQIDAIEAENTMSSIRSKLKGIYGDDFDLLAKDEQWMQRSERVCEMLLALYTETQKIPEERQGNLLRYMLSNTSQTQGKPENPSGLHEVPPSAVKRPHHYKFSHTFLRNMAFADEWTDPLLSRFRAASSETRDKVVRAIWADAAMFLKPEDLLEPEGLSVNTYKLDDTRTLSVVVMPARKYLGEISLCGIEAPTAAGTNALRGTDIRYFILQSPLVEEQNNTWVLLECFKDGTEKGLNVAIEPTVSEFVRAIAKVLSTKPPNIRGR